ncbi:MAG: hypothetical protein HC906_02175 [Bacteroidales bacterium]|nr:hypothetical protein [Bacteroidales bacterium]
MKKTVLGTILITTLNFFAFGQFNSGDLPSDTTRQDASGLKFPFKDEGFNPYTEKKQRFSSFSG